MAVDQFKPTLWAGQLIVNVDKKLVFGDVANRTYEGEIRDAGDRVKITEIGDVAVSDYTGANITFEELTDAQKELVIDQKKYFAFTLDDVDAAQAKPGVMSAAMLKAGHAIRDTVDQHLAGKYTEAGITNSTNLGASGSSLSINANDILELLTYMGRYLDEADVSEDGRWVVWPAWCIQQLKYAEIVDNTAGTPAEPKSAAFANGYIGAWLNWRHYMSNNVSNNGTQYRVMFGVEDAISYAGQVSKIEAIRREARFADAIKGLWVYGSKVVRPDHLGCAYLADGGLTS